LVVAGECLTVWWWWRKRRRGGHLTNLPVPGTGNLCNGCEFFDFFLIEGGLYGCECAGYVKDGKHAPERLSVIESINATNPLAFTEKILFESQVSAPETVMLKYYKNTCIIKIYVISKYILRPRPSCLHLICFAPPNMLHLICFGPTFVRGSGLSVSSSGALLPRDFCLLRKCASLARLSLSPRPVQGGASGGVARSWEHVRGCCDQNSRCLKKYCEGFEVGACALC